LFVVFKQDICYSMQRFGQRFLEMQNGEMKITYDYYQCLFVVLGFFTDWPSFRK